MEVPLNSVIILKRRLPTELKSAVSKVQPFFNCTDSALFSFCLGLMIFFSLEIIYLGHPFKHGPNIYPAFMLKQIFFFFVLISFQLRVQLKKKKRNKFTKITNVPIP